MKGDKLMQNNKKQIKIKTELENQLNLYCQTIYDSLVKITRTNGFL